MLNVKTSAVTVDAVDLGLVVSLMVDDPEVGLYESVRSVPRGAPLGGPYPEPDLRAVMQGGGVVSILALTADGRAFCDLVRSGDLG